MFICNKLIYVLASFEAFADKHRQSHFPQRKMVINMVLQDGTKHIYFW